MTITCVFRFVCLMFLLLFYILQNVMLTYSAHCSMCSSMCYEHVLWSTLFRTSTELAAGSTPEVLTPGSHFPIKPVHVYCHKILTNL